MRARWLMSAVVLSVVLLGMFLDTPVAAAAETGTPDGTAEAAQSLSEATGLAISPLLVLASQGAYRYWAATPTGRGSLPWYAHLYFLVPAFILILLVLLKEVILGRFVALKKPLDELQLLENTISGILACPVAVAGLAAVLEPKLSATLAASTGFLVPVAHAASAAAGMTSPMLGTFSVVASTAVAFVLFSLLWMTSHALNVLLLFSPFGIVDNVVRLLRLTLLGMVVVLTWIFPMAGMTLCLLLMVIALRLAGWSFRLLVFGAVFSVDVLFSRGEEPGGGKVWAFSSHHHQTLPPRTRGVLRRGTRDIEFTYRRGLVLGRRTVVIPTANLHICVAVLSPLVVNVADPGEYETLQTLFRLPPRYRTREAAVAAELGGLQVRETPVVGGYRALRHWWNVFVNEGSFESGQSVHPDPDWPP